ncbi:MAG: hypothetical protein MUE37_01115 [Bacteroidales bacterium]|jgi:hypothetical protein|nr:hypothetical protein [Bacteroidales bacterium]
MKTVFNVAAVLAVAAMISFSSCRNESNQNGQDGKAGIVVNGKGIELNIAEAELIQVEDRPQYNTAEWLFIIEEPGRYDVWLSSLTVDTTQLLFTDKVIITAGETKLEKKPVSDRVVTDETGIKAPWYRTDSHMGSILFAKPGEYNVQVISDRVERFASDLSQVNPEKHTLINSVILKPKVN